MLQERQQHDQRMQQIIEQYKNESQRAKDELQSKITSQSKEFGRMVQSEFLDSSHISQQRQNNKTLRYVGESRSGMNATSILESSARSRRDRSGSFDQSTISTAKLFQRHPINETPTDLIPLRQPQMRMNQMPSSGLPTYSGLGRDEELKQE